MKIRFIALFIRLLPNYSSIRIPLSIINTCNFTKRVKTFRGLTLYKRIVKTWTEEPERFVLEPDHLATRLYRLCHFYVKTIS